MYNPDIEEIEEVVKITSQLVEDFQCLMLRDGISPLNYNHLGTLDSNLKVLKSKIDELTTILDY